MVQADQHGPWCPLPAGLPQAQLCSCYLPNTPPVAWPNTALWPPRSSRPSCRSRRPHALCSCPPPPWPVPSSGGQLTQAWPVTRSVPGTSLDIQGLLLEPLGKGHMLPAWTAGASPVAAASSPLAAVRTEQDRCQLPQQPGSRDSLAGAFVCPHQHKENDSFKITSKGLLGGSVC